MTPEGQPGRDLVFNVTVKDAAGAAQDLTDLDGYALVAFTDTDSFVFGWSKNAVTNWGNIQVIDEAAGQVKILLPAAKTKHLDNKTVFIEFIAEDTDLAFGKLKLGNKDGEKIELIKLTTTAKPEPPALS